MRRFILTGAPGAGKTVILRQLERVGFAVVEEAATDIIALAHATGVDEPWTQPSFIDSIAELQKLRLDRSSAMVDAVQFHDRSPICTAALAKYSGRPISETLSRLLHRVETESLYEKHVFFVRNLGFVTQTAARRISLEDTLRFEQTHWDTYRDFGYECVWIEPGTVADRVDAIKQIVWP